MGTDQSAGQSGHASSAAIITRQTAAARAQLIAPWRELRMIVEDLLEPNANGPSSWIERLGQSVLQLRCLTAQDPDAALYLMLQTAMSGLDKYSPSHALYCSVVAELCASWLDWPEAEASALVNAALTMNIGMTSVQNAMARQTTPLTEAQRELVEAHSRIGVDILKTAGVTDSLWLETVNRHHRPIDPADTPDPTRPVQRLARLLQRIDVFTAKLSARKTRPGASATVAARDACLDDTGSPDATGATMLRVLGLYPPGGYVQLINGEVGVVTFRGLKAHTPTVACLLRGSGALVSQPSLRDAAQPEFAVKRSLSASEVRIAVVHERALSARWN